MNIEYSSNAKGQDQLNIHDFQAHIADTYGISGKTPNERISQLKELSVEGIAIFLEDINKTVNHSTDSMISDKVMKVGDKETLAVEHRHEVFEGLIREIQEADTNVSAARIADTLALGVVLLHPFKDGNGRTARTIGLMFRDEYTDTDAEDNFRMVTESRDIARKRGGWVINGYIPHTEADMTNPNQVLGYLRGLLHEEKPGSYVSCFEEAPLWSDEDLRDGSAEVHNTDPSRLIYEAYDDFNEDIVQLRMQKSEDIGTGQHSGVKKLDKDGKKYAVRIINRVYFSTVGAKEKIDVTDSHVRASALVRDMSNMEHIVAASKEDGVTISELVPGSHMFDMATEDISQIPDEHIDALLERRQEAQNRGVQIDSHVGNILYDKHLGFTDIDFHMDIKPRNDHDKVDSMVTILRSLESEEKVLYEVDPAVKEQYEAVCAATRKRMARYIDAHFTEDECKILRDQWKVSIAFQRAGYELGKKQAKRRNR